MTAAQTAMHLLQSALSHRARIGSELTSTSNMMLVSWYEEALASEELARAELGNALDSEKKSQLFEAYAV